MRVKRLIIMLEAVTLVAGLSPAATIITDSSGLNIDDFVTSGTIVGNTFTDTMGNTLTVVPRNFSWPPGSPMNFTSNGWLGDGDLVATFISPVTTAGFTFLNLCTNCTPAVIPDFTQFNPIVLNNGDSSPGFGVPAGSDVPGTLFFGVSSATPFTQAIFREPQTYFGISDFRFGTSTAVPEPATGALIAFALIAGPALALLRKRSGHHG